MNSKTCWSLALLAVLCWPTVAASQKPFAVFEEFVGLFRDTLPQVTIIGEPTRGIHSDIYLKKLSNGWQVGLSNQKYMLPDGRVYEKVGLPPHKLFDFKGDVVEKAKDELLELALFTF
jgi:C-terminal processing protease CtpA/Prc